MRFRIYYADGTVFDGEGIEEWASAPENGVQVVALMSSRPSSWPLPYPKETGFVFSGRTDRTFFTGVDEYDPLNSGVKKFGTLLSDAEYTAIWERAYDDN